MLDRCRDIIGEIDSLLGSLRPSEVEHAYQVITRAPRVFGWASGRSGFILRGFIMRLNHLGHTAYFVGEASTPPVGEGDLLLVMSGSGSTATSLGGAMEAVKLGAQVLAMVGSRVSPLGQLASAVVELPAPHKRGVAGGADGITPSRQTAGSLFEQACFVLLESMILRRFQDLGQDPGLALKRHANLEA
jgi:6-phospho-3-hexuloisomerase